MKQVIQCILFIISLNTFGQYDSIKPSLKISSYIEVYYCYDFGKPTDHNRPPFIYSFNRSNEVNLNIGFIKASFENKSTRANFAIMAGTYSNANLAAEPGVLKNIYEANAGVKIHKTKNLWIDAGVFGSHLGIEGAVGKDCWNLTRSMAAENSPYYETGVKGTYISDNSKWLISALFLNGWQRIQRIDGNNSLAVGHQVTYTSSKKLTINSSSFIGNDKPDSVKQMRYFHNLHAKYEWNQKYGLIAGFDVGAEQKAKGITDYNIWYTPYIQLRYILSPKIILAARGEYYYDKNEVIIATGTANGFQTIGYSVNTDIQINSYAVWRIEGRVLNSKDEIFTLNNNTNSKNFALTTSLAIAL